VIWMDAFGYANVESSQQATVDTPFMLASVSKTFTGTALIQLYEDGMFGIHDDINDYLPFEVINPNHPDSEISFRQLLTHSSSINDNWDVMPYCDGDCDLALGDFLEGYFTPGSPDYDADANFYEYPPSTQYNYSNIGAALIGYLVEVLAEQPFDQYCEEHIFEPLCMDNTHWFLEQFPDQSEIAIPYSWGGGEYEPEDHYGYADYPDGQLRSSVRNMANWLLAYTNEGHFITESILSQDMTNESLSVHYGTDQGYIWYSFEVDGDVVWGHNGGDLGVTTDIIVNPQEEIAVAIISNGEEWLDELVEEVYVWAKSQSENGVGWPDCVTSGVEEQDTRIAIYPNPVEDFLQVDLDGYEGEVSVKVFDMNGKLVDQLGGNYYTPVGMQTQDLDPGCYYLQLKFGESEIRKKLIKL
jgi:CubicO group peptidase (beta-lactamase class C family)